MKKAIFLDRDGTINHDYGYVDSIKRFRLKHNTIKGLQQLQKKGYLLFIVSNQSGIAREKFLMKNLADITEHMLKIFNKNKIKMSRIYYCIHHPKDKWECRKPSPYFVKRAEKKFNINLKKSYVIGDKDTDIEMGVRAGCKTIKIDDETKNLLEASKKVK